MYNDSVDTLLLRHYGRSAPIPPRLEQHLVSVVQHEVGIKHQHAYVAARIRAYRISRRRAVKLVAIGSAGLGIAGAGLEILEMIFQGSDNTHSALP